MRWTDFMLPDDRFGEPECKKALAPIVEQGPWLFVWLTVT